MIPSGPGYAGTQDTAVVVGIKALGGSGSVAVSYIVLLRFVIVVPITVLGFVLLAARYGGSPAAAARTEAARERGRVAPPRPTAARAPRGARRTRREVIAWIALVALALALRLIALGDRPFHHDESQDAYFSWIFRDRGDYQYMPILHGPLRFYLTALMYVLFGDSDFTARLAPALMGTAMVALCWLLRGLLGRVAAFTAAALLAIGPTYLYFSRFAREDIYIACITLALLAVVFRFLDRPRATSRR